MEFRDIKDVLTFAAFRPEPDHASFRWPRRFPNRRSVLVNASRSQVSWAYVDKKGNIEDTGTADGEFLDVSSSMADEWRNHTDDGWIGVSLNSRFIVTLEHNLSRKPGWDETIRTNPKSILGTKCDRSKRYAVHHNAETNSSLLLASDQSIIQTIEDSLRNHNLRPARICCGLFAMTCDLLGRIEKDANLKSQDVVAIIWVDHSLLVLRVKSGQWQEVRCRSGIPIKDANGITQMLRPFLETASPETRVLFLGDEPDNEFSRQYLPLMEKYHVTDVTERGHLWNLLARH